jgi:predicted metal-dependent hydrolase
MTRCSFNCDGDQYPSLQLSGHSSFHFFKAEKGLEISRSLSSKKSCQKEGPDTSRFCDKLASDLVPYRRMTDQRFTQGVQHFNNGEYFEAHEIWEELWNEASGARHAFLQGLIQVAVALHHAGNANWGGTRKLLSRALGYLEKGISESDPVDIAALKDLVLEFELGVQKSMAGEADALPFFKLPLKKDT